MKRKFTFLIAAAVMLLTMVATTGRMWGQSRTSTTETLTISTYASTNKWVNGTAYTPISTEHVTISGVTGGNNNKYYSSNDSWRHYEGDSGAVTVSVSSDYNLQSVKFTYANGNNGVLKDGSTNVTSGTAYGISGISKTFTVGHSSGTKNGNVQITSIEITFETAGGGSDPSISADDVNIAYNATSGSIIYEIENYVAGTMTANTTADWISGFTYQQVDEIGEVGFTTTANESVSPRSATVTLTYTYGAKSTVNKDVTVTQEGNPNAPGSQNNPYTVAEARAAIDAGTGTQGVYATGIVSEIVTDYSSQFNNISYNISSDGLTASDQLQIFRGACSGVDEVRVGDIVVVSGNLTKYSDTYEFAQGSTLSSLKLVAPTFYPEAGAVASGTALTISDLHTGATIYYTTDGTNPTTGSTPYDSENKPTITAATTFKAIAVKDNYTTSDIASAAYTLLAPAATPTFSPEAGTYTWAQNVTISTTTEGATIYYTTDGSNPTSSSSVYSEPIAVNETKTIKAIAAKDGMANSDVAEATYTMNIPAINAENVNLAYDATAGSIAYTMTNPVDGGVLTAAITGGNEGTWLTLGDVSGEAVALTCSANDGDADRSATVTLTYTYNTDKTVTKVVTVTQAHFVVDYATLPFNWAGGASADFLALAGVSAYGLGSDYGSTHSPYNIKFDGTNDYIQVKTDSQPAKVTIGVKMIGGGNTSYINIQESSDGTNFTDVQELTISGSSNDIVNLATTEDFASTTRYVRMVFTKGSNVGVGPIAITKYTTDPIINAEDVNITCDATNGSIAYTISNPVVGGVLTASTTSEWLVLGSVTTSVPFTCTANTTEENRSATVTLTYTYNTSETVTKDVTVTQSRRDFALLPFAYDGNGSGVLPCGLTQEGVGAYAAAPKMKFDDTGDYLILKLEGAPVSISYDIKGNSFSGGTFKVQVSANGSSYTDIETYTVLGETQTITLLNSDDNVRYIKWVYTKKVNGNVALGNLNVTTELIINGDCTVDNITISNTEVLTIEAGSVMTITGTLTNEGDASNLIIEDGGQLIHNGNVTATLKKNVAGYNTRSVSGWYTIASPVADMDVNCATTGTYDFFAFNEENTKWLNQKVAANNITNFEQGVGYLYANADATVIDYLGTLIGTETEVTKPLSYACENASYQGINLMGNPFSRNLVAGDIEIAGTPLTTYYTVEGGNELTAKTLASTPIKPGQGFMVQATASSQNLVFNPTSKDRSAAKVGYISIVAGNSEFTDNAFVQVGGGNTLRKMTLSDNSSVVYVMSDGKDYAAANIDALEGSMPICFKANTLGTYTITIETNDVDAEYLHLIDNFTHEDIDLLLEPSYSFIASNGDRAGRFTLVFRSIGSEGTTNNLFAYQNNNDIVVNGEGELQVFDVTGRMVATQHVNGVQTVNVPSQGVFIFKLNEKTQKIVVR